MGYLKGNTPVVNSSAPCIPPQTLVLLESMPQARRVDYGYRRDFRDDNSGRRERRVHPAWIFSAGVAAASAAWLSFGLYMAKREDRISRRIRRI